MLHDLRFAIRLLVKDRWVTVGASMALAVGIGMNATVFTIVDALLLRAVPFADPARVMYIGERDTVTGRTFMVSWPDFQDWRASQRSFVALAAWSAGTMNVSDDASPAERYNGAYFSANAFAVLGGRPIIGRDFLPADDVPGAAPVVVLAEATWRNRYGADPSIVGRIVRVNDRPATVVGVMPASMQFPDAGLWMPLAQLPGLQQKKRDERFGIQAFGRLQENVPRRQAQAELSAIATRLQHDYPATNHGVDATVMTFNERIYGGPIRLLVLAAMGAVAFVLLIACANVATLVLARSTPRAREIAIRVSLGATRWRIVRQLLIESTALACIGGTFGFMLAAWGIRWFDTATLGLGRPSYLQFTLDTRVVLFFLAMCVATGLVFGLAPALHLSRTDVNEIMKHGSRGGGGGSVRRGTGVLIVAEVTMTLVLLAGAGFMIRSFLALYKPDVKIDTDHILTMNLSLPDARYATPALRAAFYQAVDERLNAMSGVRATPVSSVPFGGGVSMPFTIEGRQNEFPAQAPQVTRVTIGPRYFDVVGLSLEAGRGFTDDDGSPGHEVAIINRRAASRFFAHDDAIGHRIRLTAGADGAGARWMTIVGISPTVRQRNTRELEPDAVVYVPYRFSPDQSMTLLVRTDGDPASAAGLVREDVRILDPGLPLFGVATLNDLLVQFRWPYRVFGLMFTTCAAVALLLSAVALYATTAYAVALRTREIGVRIALGAEPRQIQWLILRSTSIQLAIGLTLGMAGALGVGRLLRSVLARSGPTDPATLLSVAAIFIVVALAAACRPARSAIWVDPAAAVRCE